MRKVTIYDLGCDSPSNFTSYSFERYRIVCDYESASRKYGIIDCNRFVFIVPYIFDKIRWIEKYGLVEVVYHGKCALCPIAKIRTKLVPVCGKFPELENNAIPYYASFQREYDDLIHVNGISRIEGPICNGSELEDETGISDWSNSYSESLMNPNGYFGPLEVWNPNKIVCKFRLWAFLKFPNVPEIYKQYMIDNEINRIIIRYFTIVLINGHPHRFYTWLLDYGEFETTMVHRAVEGLVNEEDARKPISIFRKKCWGDVSDFVSKYRGAEKLMALAGKEVKIRNCNYYVLKNGHKRFYLEMGFV